MPHNEEHKKTSENVGDFFAGGEGTTFGKGGFLRTDLLADILSIFQPRPGVFGFGTRTIPEQPLQPFNPSLPSVPNLFEGGLQTSIADVGLEAGGPRVTRTGFGGQISPEAISATLPPGLLFGGQRQSTIPFTGQSDEEDATTEPFTPLDVSVASDEDINRRIGELQAKLDDGTITPEEMGELEVLLNERTQRQFPLTLLQSFLPSLLQMPLDQQRLGQEQQQFEASQAQQQGQFESSQSQMAQQFAQQFGLDERQVALAEQQELQRQQEMQAQIQREQDARVQRGNVALSLFPDISLPATVTQQGLSQETFNQLIQVAILRAQQEESERERTSRPPLLVNTLFG